MTVRVVERAAREAHKERRGKVRVVKMYRRAQDCGVAEAERLRTVSGQDEPDASDRQVHQPRINRDLFRAHTAALQKAHNPEHVDVHCDDQSGRCYDATASLLYDRFTQT